MDSNTTSLVQLNNEGRDLWDSKAAFWDNLHGDQGNEFHQRLVEPAVDQLLALRPGEKVLDIACGSGVVARHLAELGAQVTATDFSAELITLAQERGQQAGHPIDYRVVDATDETALLALGIGQFEAIVCTMALMDIPELGPLYRAVARLLKPNGRFVFANAHPAFNSNNPVFLEERGDTEGVPYTVTGVKIFSYIDMPPVKGGGARGEPNPHYYYHRPLQQLLGEAFTAGLVLDGMIEPTYPPSTIEGKALSWDKIWQIPPVIACRLRVR